MLQRLIKKNEDTRDHCIWQFYILVNLPRSFVSVMGTEARLEQTEE